MAHLVEFGEMVVIELVYVVNEGIKLFCLFSVVKVDIFISFRVQHFFGYGFLQIRIQIVIFITFRVHKAQIKKLTINRNKTKKGGFRGAQMIGKGYINHYCVLSCTGGIYFYQFLGKELFSGTAFCKLRYR